MKLNEISTGLSLKDKAIQACKRYKIKYSEVHSDGTVDTEHAVLFFQLKTKKLPIKFGTVNSIFQIQFADNLTTLLGSPKIAQAEICLLTGLPQLKSLKDGPTKVLGRFEVFNSGITSLEGAPEEVGKSVHFEDNRELENLDFLPKKINGKFTLIGSPLVKDYLKIFKIKGCTSVRFSNKRLAEVFNKYLPTHDLIGCQDELLDIPELEEYAD